jgi:hypothetical protein
MAARQPQVEVETITPARAKELLGVNTHNRHVKDRHVATLAASIERGDWQLNGEMIRLDTKGNLIDGQHRLLAVVKANKSIKSFVGTGFPVGSQETLDTGKARTLSDVLKLRGEANYAALGAAARKVWAYERYGLPLIVGSHRAPTIQEAIETIERHPGLRNSTDLIGGSGRLREVRGEPGYGGTRASKLMEISAVIALHYLMALADEDDANAFWEGVGSGVNLEATDPRYVLRERLIKELDDPSGGIHAKIKVVFAVRAWNAWQAGESVTRFVFKAGGARPDRFPRIYGVPLEPKLEIVGNQVVERIEDDDDPEG